MLTAILFTLFTATAWHDDIAFVRHQIETKHPNPYRRISKPALDTSFDRLQKEVPSLTDDQIAIRLMRIVASLRDGHTSLVPGEESGYDQWFPIRLYEFSDGVFVTAIDKTQAKYAGAKVIRIGSMPIADAVRLVRGIHSSDNDFAAKDAVSLLSSARLAHALGIIPTSDAMPLEVQSRDGAVATITLAAIKGRSRFGWIYWGEIEGPPGSGVVTAFESRPSDAFYDAEKNLTLPLHLRFRGAYWFTYLEKPRLLYMQLNAMADKSSFSPEPFSAFLHRAFLFADLHPVDRFVLDLRYNSGGNGRLVNAVVHEIIKREESLGRSGHLFVLTGRKTYSAGTDLALSMQKHTSAIFGGEPMGASRNGSGDPDVATLPNSGFRLAVSTNYSTSANSRDQSWLTPVQLPAAFTSSDYFGGKDPALELILSADGASIMERLVTDGGEAAKALYARSKKRFGALDWWEPFDRIQMNETGFQLLERERAADALAAMEMNVDRFPDSWETWDSLAEVLLGMKRNAEAIRAYEKALALSPDNWNNGAEKRAIETMRKAP